MNIILGFVFGVIGSLIYTVIRYLITKRANRANRAKPIPQVGPKEPTFRYAGEPKEPKQ